MQQIIIDNETWDARSISNVSNILEKDRIAMLAMELARKLVEK